MQVPLLDLITQNLALEAEFKAAFDRVLHSGRYISGTEVAEFEKATAAYAGAAEAIAISSGTDALLVALMALGIGPGDEVLCPSFTFFATAGCVHRLGATPVFVDCDLNSFNARASDYEKAITNKTTAIIPVHLFGQMADMAEILDLANRRGLAVVEDAAQSLGATYRDQGAGAMGDLGIYSFFPSKNLGGLGEGGMIVTSNPDLAHRCRLFRNHGMEPRYHHSLVGGNFRLDEIQAALLRIKLERLESYIAGRERNAAAYRAKLAPLTGKLILPEPGPECRHIWNQFTLRLPAEGARDGLKAHLTAQGIGCEIYYPVPLHQQKCFASIVDPAAAYPVTETLSRQVLSLPVYPELRPEQIDHVVSQVHAYLA